MQGAQPCRGSEPLAESVDAVRIRTTRIVLNAQQAAEIFLLRPTMSTSDDINRNKFRKGSSELARAYGVSPKTIRDIWQSRTWSHATIHLGNGQASPLMKNVGRPKGSRDTQPRQRPGWPTFGVNNSVNRSGTMDLHIQCLPDVDPYFTASFNCDQQILLGGDFPKRSLISDTFPESKLRDDGSIDTDTCFFNCQERRIAPKAGRTRPENVSVDWILGEWEFGCFKMRCLPDPYEDTVPLGSMDCDSFCVLQAVNLS